MTLWNRFRSWLRAILRRSRMESEMDAELRFHIEAFAEDLVRSGVPRQEALRRARLEFGGIDRAKEECREARGVNLFDSLLQDLRFGLRMLRKNPGFTAAATLTLALGIGANTAIFSAVYSLLLKPLPYPDPERLVFLWCRQPSRGIPELPPSIPDYLDWQKQLHSFDAIAGFWGAEFAINHGSDSRRVLAIRAFADYFDVLRRAPLLGRTFTAEDERWGHHRVVLISEGLWRSMFAGDSNILGRTIAMDAEPYTVVGVMPTDFTALNPRVQMWVPVAVPPNLQLRRIDRFMRVIGRMKKGISERRAAADLQGTMAALADTYDEDKGISTYLVSAQHQVTDGRTRAALFVLFGAVGVLLLIACVNIANLISVRASAREKELAVRTALGAGRFRLVRQLIAEHLVLAACGGMAGIALAYWGVDVLRQVAAPQIARAGMIRIDPEVLLFGFALTVFTGILCSALPAVQASRCAVHHALKQGERGSGSGVGGRSRRMLVIIETALSLALLICAGLLINTIYRLRAVDPGFGTERILAAEIDLPDAHYNQPQQRKQFIHELMARVSRLPGVGAVGATETLPLHPGNQFWVGFERQGYPLGSWEKMPVVAFAHVTPGYFAAMEIPILRGRAIAEHDTAESQPVAVISETLRRRFFANQDPIGTRIRLGEGSDEWLTVVGIVGDVSLEALDRPKPPYVYVSFNQGIHGIPGDMLLVLDTATEPLALASALRKQVQELDPSLGIADLTTLSSVVSESLDQPRLTATLMTLFAGAAALLAVIGIYGVLAYAVTQRTKEIGIRIALGARANEVALLVIGDGLRTTLIGIASGIALAAVGTRALTSLLYGVRPLDTVTYVSAAALLLVIAAVAAYLPARRATRVDPIVALRYE